jgi:hypothetical protein
MAKEGEVPSYQEWLKTRQHSTNENRARADAYHDSAKKEDKWLWTWFRDSFLELNAIYKALEWADGYRKQGDTKIMQIVRDNQTKIERQYKMMLGLDDSATQEDVEERAKILGEFIDGIIDKAKQKMEQEQKLKKKVFKEK